MKKYIVLYRIEKVMTELDSPFGFLCDADNTDHAEDQCINAYPDCDIMWIAETDSYSEALEQYYYFETE